MRSYDILVIGGGPAGCMAAIQAATHGKKTALVERNDCIGKKLGLTGNTRCNITNTSTLDEYLRRFGKTGSFYRNALSVLDPDGLLDIFRKEGHISFREEGQGKIYPIDANAQSVISVLRHLLKKQEVSVVYNRRVDRIRHEKNTFIVVVEDGRAYSAAKVILATGGRSYPQTGSSGDGILIARHFGHTVTPLTPGLTPLIIQEEWVKKLKGISLSPVGIKVTLQNKTIISEKGSLLFTHYGVSGPLILDISNALIPLFENHAHVSAILDLVPERREEDILQEISVIRARKGNSVLSSFMSIYLPQRMTEVLASYLPLPADKPLHQLTKSDLQTICNALKKLPITVTGHLSWKDAMVTCGGISQSEIDPRTMQSKLIPGLFFAGEIIDGAGPSGGYNLQKAFSTGYLAGENSAR